MARKNRNKIKDKIKNKNKNRIKNKKRFKNLILKTVPVKKQRKVSQKSGASVFFLVMAALGGFSVVSPGTSGAILLCMLPTIVLLIGKSDNMQMLRAQCVGFLNAAAAFPYIMNIYNEKTTLIAEIMEKEIFLVAWGAALIGTFLQYIAPIIAAWFLQLIADENLSKVKGHQGKLLDEWGPEVTGIKETEA